MILPMQNAVTLNERFRQTPRTSRCLDGCRWEGGYPLAANARPAELLGRGISSAPSSGKDFAAKLNFNFWKTKKFNNPYKENSDTMDTNISPTTQFSHGLINNEEK